MAERVVGETGSSGSTQVFVDDSGRRKRWVRLAGAGVTVLCAAYMGIVAVGFSQTAVGPLIAVPSDGNGRVAGFPDTSGVVPGLLATGGIGVARPVHRAAAPAPLVRPREVAAAPAVRPAVRPAKPAGTPVPSSSADTGSGAKSATARGGSAPAPAPAPAPAHGSGSAADSGHGRSGTTSGTAVSAVTA